MSCHKLLQSHPLRHFRYLNQSRTHRVVVCPVSCCWPLDATLLANNFLHCWTLHVASVCKPCCMLLDVVAQNLKPVKLFSPHLPTLLLFRDHRSVAQQCWIRLQSSSNIVGATHAYYAWFTKTYGLYPSHDALQVPTLLGVVASVCTPLPTRTQELPTLLAQQCWELLRFDRFQTLLNNTQQHPTTSNGVCKRTQHVRSNNVESCWPTMLRPFARGLRVTFLGKGFQLRTRRKHLWVFSSNNVCSHVDLFAP